MTLAASSCALLGDNDPQFSYDPAGEPVTCLPVSGRVSLTALDDRTVIVNTAPSIYYRSTLTPGCRGTDQLQRRLEYDVFSGSLCRGETLKVVDNTDGITTGFCQFGVFEPVKRVPNAP